MNKAICILCIKPDENQINFYKGLTNMYDVFFMCDFDYNFSIQIDGIKFVNINQTECLRDGFINSNTAVISKTPIAWDKGIYYFSTVNTQYDYVWFLEEDVLVPSLKTIPQIDSKYSDEDLLVCSNISYEDEPLWLHWKEAYTKIDKPYYKSMVCAIRVSKILLQSIKSYVDKKHTLFFIELLFNTIASQNNLKIKTIPELSTITFKEQFEQIADTNLYHPFKDLNYQNTIRKQMGA